MVSLNKVLLMGNLTRDPQLRYTTSGLAVCSFGLATNRHYRDRDGQTQEEVCFIDLDVLGKPAELCKQYLHKGSPALIEGRLHSESWTDRDSGQKRSRLIVRAENVQFLGRETRPLPADMPPAAPPRSATADRDEFGDSIPF